MKISLIAALAAIAGITLAPRGPYPRESGVAVLARDVNPPPIRGSADHLRGQRLAARYQKKAAEENERTGRAARVVAAMTTGVVSQSWERVANIHMAIAQAHRVDMDSHLEDMTLGHGGPNARESIAGARGSITEAKRVTARANSTKRKLEIQARRRA